MPGARLYVMRLMQAIPKGSPMNRLIMNLTWSWRKQVTKYLDGSAIIFNGNNHLGTVDWKTKEYRSKGESGEWSLQHIDNVTKMEKQGVHQIHIQLDRIPDDVTDVFFVLSVFKDSEGTKFGDLVNPKAMLVDASEKRLVAQVVFNKELRKKESLIVGRMYRSEGGWDIVEVLKMSDGTATDEKGYEKIIRTIKTNCLY